MGSLNRAVLPRSSAKPMRIAVGMSGGVDSSVAALLLLKAGHEVSGVLMKVRSGPAGGARRPGGLLRP